MTLNRDRIANAIRAELLAGPFYLVVYDPQSKQSATDQGQPRAPASVTCNETRISLGDAVNKRSRVVEIETWEFEARASFQGEVSAEAFLERVTNPPPMLPRSGALRQAELLFRSVTAEHPVQQEAPRGTRYTFHVSARIYPR